MDRIKHIQTFTGGMNTVLAPKLLPSDKYEYMLNCNVFSTAEGNVGAVTNTRGTLQVQFDLPAGINKTIGWAADEERNNLYFFVYNSASFHGIYRYNAVDNAVVKVMRCIEDTGDIDIFRWKERDLILHANVIGNNLLYWCVRGEDRHPPRKINIDKALDRSTAGYNGVIKEEYTRAYKRTSAYPPRAEYFTDTTKKFNRVYGRLFKFAIRYGYDDNEWSNWSSFSSVPTPDFERYSGSLSVPLENNGINVYLNTGGYLVKRIEIAMMSTNPEGGTMPFVSVDTIDKEEVNVGDNSDYVYSFYDLGGTEPIGDQLKLYRLYSYLPKDARCQEFTNNALVYANFHEGFPVVKVDVDHSVRYEDLFIPSDQENELNEPSITLTNVTTDRNAHQAGLFNQDVWKAIRATLVIGADVKRGNEFKFTLYDSKKNPRYSHSVKAGISDTAKTIATKFANKFREQILPYSTGTYGNDNGFEFINPVTEDIGGNAYFEFKYWNAKDAPYLSYATSVNPVETNSLKNAGQSVQNIKLGSSAGYALCYMDEDGRVTAAYRSDGMTVSIDTINTLGSIKKPVVSLVIKHSPPAFAASYQIVRTDDLVYNNYIQMLVQKTVNYSDGSDEYLDLVLGSLFTYQGMHPNSTLKYEFRKGDRVRLIKEYDGSEWVVPPESKDFEVLSYFPITEDVIDSDITVNGTSTVTVASASTDHIGSYIRVNGAEREIVDAPSATTYELSEELTSGDPANATKKFPSYVIINNRGIIRIKNDPENPIVADPPNGKFPLVEIYSPSLGLGAADEDLYSEFGQVYPIIGFGTDSPYHGGSVQDQNALQPAIVEISAGTSYVRYRELPVNSNVDNPQVLVTEVEDPSYSDFYVSDLTDNGRRVPLDKGDGEVLFDERMRFSNNYIQGTRINGLNDFDNLDRKDYNDKYGAIERIWFEEGILVVFKHLKDAWASVFSSIITDQGGNPLLAKSDQLLPDKLQYYAWDGGVGNNPESVSRLGTQYFHVSPTSMIVARLGGNGVDDISKMYGVDPTVRQHISSANKAGAQIHGGPDAHNEKYDVSIEQHDNVISDTPISESGWQNDMDAIPSSGVTYTIISGPSHGDLDVSGAVADYTPDNGYSGPDTFSYEVFVDGQSVGTRNVCLTVVYQEGPRAWRPIGQFCALVDGARNGYSGWSTLEEYDTYHGTATGNTKPNTIGDPDYVAPVYDAVSCPPQEQFLLFTTTSNASSVDFEVGTVSTPVIMFARSGGSIINTGTESSNQNKTLNLSANTGSAEVWIRGPVGVKNLVTRIVSNSNSVTSENTSIYPNVTWMEFRNGLLTVLSVTPVTNLPLQYIIYSDNSVANFDPSGFINLYALTFTNNGVSVMPLGNHPDLEELAGSVNSMTGIDTDQCPNLRYVELQYNNLTSSGVGFSNNPGLKVLYIASNPALTTLTWSDLTGLTSLTIDKTLISVFDPSVMPDLMYLDITQCPISAFSINSNDDIIDLRCGECDFTADDADPSIIDAVIIKMDSNIASGGVLHYDTLVPGGIQPTSASLAAYNSLVSKGCELQGKVPA